MQASFVPDIEEKDEGQLGIPVRCVGVFSRVVYPSIVTSMKISSLMVLFLSMVFNTALKLF
jgi:hypothetical protein